MSKRLKTEQLIVLDYLAQPNKGGLTNAQIAAKAGVSERVIYKWLHDPTFDAELRRRSKLNASKYVPDVTHAMAKAAINGNAAAAKLILQMAGLLTDKHEVVTIETGASPPDIDELRRLVAEIDEG